MAKTTSMPPSDDGGEKVNKPSPSVAGKGDGSIVPNPDSPAEESVDTLTNQNNNDEIPTVNTVVDGIEYPELKEQGQMIVTLDRLLIQNEARGTIFEITMGIKAKEIKATLEAKNKKGKQLKDALEGYFDSLKLSAARSPRTIQRYMQVVDKMIADKTLTGTILDALRSANFGDDIKGQVLQLTQGMGITKLYEKYGMVADKRPSKGKVDKTLEEQLMDEVLALVGMYNKLTSIRGKMVTAGQAVDPGLDEMMTKVCDAAVALSKHPIIAAKLKTLEDEAGAEGATG